MRDGLTKKMLAIRELLDSRRSDIELWIQQGRTLEQMGADLGVNYGTVRNYCIRNSIPYNTKRGWRFGSNTGEDHHSWKGGRHVAPDGYVYVLAKGHPNANRQGMIREHRLVMSNILGRPLASKEVVHHIDGNKSNNHPDNLELLESNGAHIHHHHTGWKWTEESRKRLSAATKGKVNKPHSPEHREKMRALMTGRVFSQETIQKMKDAAKNRKPRTQEQRMAAAESMRKAHEQNPDWGKKAGDAMAKAMREKRQSQNQQQGQINASSH